jgi:tRNA dimethylallyltransferase
MALAERLPVEIVSVDSALVYRRLDIGSAKPSAAERAAVPHHLIDIRDPWESYSAAEFAKDAAERIGAIAVRGRVPLLVGGTGLYFRALLEGLSPMPDSDPRLRAALAEELAAQGSRALHAELAQVDPELAARIHPTDPQRILRALEVFRASGRPLSAWQGEGRAPARAFAVLKLALSPSREELHRRIAQRFSTMLAQGLVDEVRGLLAEPRLHAELPAMRAVGYRQTWDFLSRGGTESDLSAKAIAATRQLAKRQLTWLRAEPDLFWIDPGATQDLWRRVADYLDAD